MNKLVLVKQTEFEGTPFDCYVKPKQEDKGDFWATREQIGRLLEYENPEISVANIHNRHSERLDKFSTLTKLIRVEGGREVAREVTVYSFKGLLEVCRYSNQPKADAVMDWLFDVADEIRRTGRYSLKRKTTKKTPALSRETMSAAAEIYHRALHCEDNSDVQEVFALDKAFQHFTGESALQIANFTLDYHTDFVDNGVLKFKFTHPEIELMELQAKRNREMYESPEYLNMMEEMRYAGRCY